MFIGISIQIITDKILITLIDPNLLNKYIGFPEDVSKTPEKYILTKSFNHIIEQTLIYYAFYLPLGAIISLIVGAIMHKRPIQ